jgi:hypothetical protein
VPADAWKRLLGYVSSRKPALYNIMLSVKIVFSEEAAWRLISGNEFETGMIEKARPELEQALEGFAGRKVTLKPETSAAAPAAAQEISAPEEGFPEGETVVDDIEAEAANEAPQPHKAQGPKQVGAETEPELKHLAKVFHGRITRINKLNPK